MDKRKRKGIGTRPKKVEVEMVESDEGEMETEEQGSNGGLECDFSAYVLFHGGSSGAPCLSFDILKDELGDNRNCDTPVTCYFASGTQAAKAHLNVINIFKVQNLTHIVTEESDEEESEDEDEDKNVPVVTSVSAKHVGCVNRLRATCVNNVPLAATWSDSGEVNIWDLSRMLDAVNDPQALQAYERSVQQPRPLFNSRVHSTEGFAVDWSSVMPGTLATGDCHSNIYVWKPIEGGVWAINSRPFKDHSASVEDIQWSPNEPHVFASCSVDRSIRVWDARVDHTKACMLTANNTHDNDVNVINWNRNEPFIVSGGDDGAVKVWDLRTFKNASPLAILKHHISPVTTVEWHPSDSSVLATGGEDDQILQWDLAVERDTEGAQEGGEGGSADPEEKHVPAQLLFVHKGQKEIKELHWHPQIPGVIVSTAHSGFNIFKTISC